LRAADSEKGFGLISVLIAMVLLAIGVATLATTSMMVNGVKTEAAVRTTATAIASAYLEEIKTRDLAELSSEAPVRVDHDGHETEDGAFVRSLTVTPEEDVEETKRLIVAVQYPSGLGRIRTVELETLIYHGSWQYKS
jgi:Tfp pilus assembly protein PilV